MTTYTRGQKLICVAGGVRRKVTALSCHQGDNFEAVKVNRGGVEWIVKPQEVRPARWIDTVSRERGHNVKKQVLCLRSKIVWGRDSFAFEMKTTKSGASNILGNLVILGFAKMGLDGELSKTYHPTSPCGCCKNEFQACLCFKED